MYHVYRYVPAGWYTINIYQLFIHMVLAIAGAYLPAGKPELAEVTEEHLAACHCHGFSHGFPPDTASSATAAWLVGKRGQGVQC